MSEISRVYTMNQESMRKQTHLGNLNIFALTKCSICQRRGHNKLGCVNFEIPRIVEELVDRIYNFFLENSCTGLKSSLDYIITIPFRILNQICMYLRIYVHNFHSKKYNIYIKIRRMIFQKYNLKIVKLSPSILTLFEEKKRVFGVRNTFPNNSTPAYSFDLYCKSPVFHVMGCYQYASNILLKYGNRFTSEVDISLELFTNLLFIDILRFTYDSTFSVLCAMIPVTYDEYGYPQNFGHTVNHFRVLLNNGQIYPYGRLPRYFPEASYLENELSPEGLLLSQRLISIASFNDELPIPAEFHIQLKMKTSSVAEEKTTEEIPEKLEEEMITSECAEPKSSGKETLEEIQEKEEERMIVECPICYHQIVEENIITINSCHHYCIDCMVSYLHSAKLKEPTCAMCRDKILHFQTGERNIELLKSQFSFNETKSTL